MKQAHLILASIATLLISACGGGGSDGGGNSTPTAIVLSGVPYNGSVVGANHSYYTYTTIASVNAITVSGQSSDIDPVVYTDASFTSFSSNWTCTANANTMADSCTTTTPVPAGTVLYIKVKNWDGVSTTFTLAVAPAGGGAPTVTSFTPSSGAAGTTVSITGTNFSATPANNTVRFNGYGATVTAATATSLTVTVPSGASTGAISVQTAGGFATSSGSFTVSTAAGGAPTITSFSPTTGQTDTIVTITGTNFSTNPDNNTVYFSTSTAASTANVVQAFVMTATATSLTVRVPYYAITGVITVTTAAGTAESVGSFVIFNPLAPTITSFTPTSGAEGTRVTITGTNFRSTTTANLVKFNGSPAQVTGVNVMGTSMWALVPSGASTGAISVMTTDGIGISAGSFTVNVPPPLANTLTVSPTSLSFGSQTAGGYYYARVDLTNTGAVNLNITGIAIGSGSSSDFQLGFDTCYNSALAAYSTLAPGASCYQEVRFNPAVIGTSTGTLSVTSTATGSPHSVSLSGTGVAPLVPVVSLSANSLTFAAQDPGTSSAPQVIALRNTGTAALNITEIGLVGDYAQTNTCGTSLAAGASCSISVTFTPAPLTGPLISTRIGELWVRSNAAGSPHAVGLGGTVNLGMTGQVAIFTREPWGIQDVAVDNVYVGGNIKYDSQNTCGGIGAITVTLAPGTHSISAYDPILSIAPAYVTVTAGGCTAHQITGTSTCVAPSVLLYGVCYPPTATPTCTSPQVLQNGVCVTPTPACISPQVLQGGVCVTPTTGTGSGGTTGGSTGSGGLSNCTEMYSSAQGTMCTGTNSWSMRFRNACSVPVDMKYCLQRTDGTWDCGVWSNTAPGDSTSHYVCDGTGFYKTDSRDAGSSVQFTIP